MKNKFKKTTLRLLAIIFFMFSTFSILNTEELYALDNGDPILMKKVSKSFTKKFCNSIGFGLSKDSAIVFSLKENNQVFKRRKGFNNLDKDLLADKIATEVVENCGYGINLKGEKGAFEFKTYYLAKDLEYIGKN
tara:strand:- start:106 stop:510 length:405 start_codon:yes stop_codon:yes gene_type:complete